MSQLYDRVAAMQAAVTEEIVTAQFREQFDALLIPISVVNGWIISYQNSLQKVSSVAVYNPSSSSQVQADRASILQNQSGIFARTVFRYHT